MSGASEKQRVLFIEEMQAGSRIQAAGNFYGFVVVNPGGVGVLVADVTGHGVPAALIASMVKVEWERRWRMPRVRPE